MQRKTASSSEKKLAVFIALSVLLHATLIFTHDLVPELTPEINFSKQMAHSMRITLSEKHAPEVSRNNPANRTEQAAGIKKQTTEKNTAVKHKPSPHRALTKPGPEQPDNKQPRTRPAQAAAPAKNNTLTSSEDNTEIQQALIVHIEGEIKKHFSYPRIAKQRGWQGSVTLAFNVNKNGNIQNVLITKSSGFEILDQAAKKSLLKVRVDARKININSFKLSGLSGLTLPVIYRLQEG